MNNELITSYIEGETHKVWDYVYSHYPIDQKNPLYEEITPLLELFFDRIKFNIDTIYNRLLHIGFIFDTSWEVEPGCGIHRLSPETIIGVEQKIGSLPLALRLFYQKVGSINLLGTHPEIPLTSYRNPLFILPLHIAIYDYEEWLINCQEYGVQHVGPYGINISPDAYHKANVSGGEGYKIQLPNLTVDGTIENEPHHLNFINYLRTSILVGGFPSFQTAYDLPSDMRHYLTHDLLVL